MSDSIPSDVDLLGRDATMNDALPVAIGIITELMRSSSSGRWEARLIVRCPRCGGEHVHGWLLVGPRGTQRHSPCSANGVRGGEYHIRPARRGEPGYERHAFPVDENGDVRII